MASRTVSIAPTLAERYECVRNFSDAIVAELTPEDCMIQSMPDVSPTRWHLAHTTWFFETFVLAQQDGYQCFDEQFQYLFNSYYNSVGKQFPRPQRGLISRPGLARIREYRRCIDRQMDDLLTAGALDGSQAHAVEVGLHHEQQHQELMLTDIKHVLSCNPTLPAYDPKPFAETETIALDWHAYAGGDYQFGHATEQFCFDNELPRHTAYLQDFQLANRLVTCGEYLEFIEDGGYRNPQTWLSLGWSTVQENQWDAPLYWVKRDGTWMVYTLAGLTPVNADWPICHISYFEADAYARWRGCRLPTEFEWEHAAESTPNDGQFADQLVKAGLAVHPTRAGNGKRPTLFGGVWQWTSSSYGAYPGYQPPGGALGEYNGKFMCNQYVLRGGSVATSLGHVRPTYRNFFPPESRWQFSGIRLAR